MDSVRRRNTRWEGSFPLSPVLTPWGLSWRAAYLRSISQWPMTLLLHLSHYSAYGSIAPQPPHSCVLKAVSGTSDLLSWLRHNLKRGDYTPSIKDTGIQWMSDQPLCTFRCPPWFQEVTSWTLSSPLTHVSLNFMLPTCFLQFLPLTLGLPGGTSKLRKAS